MAEGVAHQVLVSTQLAIGECLKKVDSAIASMPIDQSSGPASCGAGFGGDAAMDLPSLTQHQEELPVYLSPYYEDELEHGNNSPAPEEVAELPQPEPVKPGDQGPSLEQSEHPEEVAELSQSEPVERSGEGPSLEQSEHKPPCPEMPEMPSNVEQLKGSKMEQPKPSFVESPESSKSSPSVKLNATSKAKAMAKRMPRTKHDPTGQTMTKSKATASKAKAKKPATKPTTNEPKSQAPRKSKRSGHDSDLDPETIARKKMHSVPCLLVIVELFTK